MISAETSDIKKLIEDGAEVNVQYSDGESPLLLAVNSGKPWLILGKVLGKCLKHSKPNGESKKKIEWSFNRNQDKKEIKLFWKLRKNPIKMLINSSH